MRHNKTNFPIVLFVFQGAYLVNIARGGLFDYNAVFNHLKSGHLGGWGIDVAWTEPFDPDDAILKFPNVIITPHVAGVTEPAYRHMAKVFRLLFLCFVSVEEIGHYLLIWNSMCISYGCQRF